MEITGIIHKVYDTKQVSDKFKLREFVVKTNDQYPQFVKLQLTQDKCSLLDKFFKPNDAVKVSINIRGKEFTGKDGAVNYFNSIEAWRLEKLDGEQGTTSHNDPIGVVDESSLPF